jgi:superfamily II DNA/RNA helicase
VIVFCSKKQNVKVLTSELKRAKLAAEEIHSDLDQKSREQYLQDFRNQKTNILVATDILSRGIDIDDIDLVINYDVPNDGEDYIHRIGRTARAATSGTAFTLVGEKEQSDRREEHFLDGSFQRWSNDNGRLELTSDALQRAGRLLRRWSCHARKQTDGTLLRFWPKRSYREVCRATTLV